MKKELRDWLKAEIKKIDDDERFHYEPALVQINAPLALEQVAMKSRMRTLKEVQSLLNAKH